MIHAFRSGGTFNGTAASKKMSQVIQGAPGVTGHSQMSAAATSVHAGSFAREKARSQITARSRITIIEHTFSCR